MIVKNWPWCILIARDRSGCMRTIFMSWSKTSTAGEELKVMRYAFGGGSYSWSDPNSSMYQPIGIGPSTHHVERFTPTLAIM